MTMDPQELSLDALVARIVGGSPMEFFIATGRARHPTMQPSLRGPSLK